MSLKIYKDFTEPSGSSSVPISLAYNGNIYAVTTQPRIRLYNQETFENTKVSQAITSGAQGITLINSASAVMCHNSATVSFVELSSLYTTTVTSGAAAAPTGYNQLAAGNPSTGNAILARSTSGGVIKATSSQVLTVLTPAALSGATATAIVVKDSNFIIGTNNGKVMEMDASGTVTTNITLPTTPAVTAPTLTVTGLVYYNDNLLVLTDLGLMFLYKWSTSTLLDTQITSFTTAGSTSCLVDLSSGSAAGSWFGNTSSFPICEIYFDSGKIMFEDTAYVQIVPKTLVCDPTTNFIGVGGNSSSFTSYASLKYSKTGKVQIPTRLQDPAGLDIPGRVIRLRKSKIGVSIVESDTSVGTGVQNLVATDSRSYMEVAVRTSPEKFDIREFDA